MNGLENLVLKPIRGFHPNGVIASVLGFERDIFKWQRAADLTPGANITFGQVVLLPGEGHTRHNHPLSEEILYVLSGVGEQMVDDEAGFEVRAGDTIYIPTAIYHSTVNTGWDKANHALAFASLAFSAVWALWQRPRQWPVLVAALLVYGVGIEIAQSFLPPREADWHDVVADGVGIALGLLAAWPIAWLRPGS